MFDKTNKPTIPIKNHIICLIKKYESDLLNVYKAKELLALYIKNEPIKIINNGHYLFWGIYYINQIQVLYANIFFFL